MPKIRGVKPETWTDDKFVQLTPLARLLYIGMWNYACDNGHVEDNAVQLKIRLLPVDNCDVSKLLKEMETTGQIVRKEGFIKVVKLAEHQTPDKRFITTCEHCFDDPDTTYDPLTKTPRSKGARSAHVVDPTSAPSVHVDEGDCDGDVDSEVDARGKPARRATQFPRGFAPNETNLQLLQERGLDPASVLSAFSDYHQSKGSTFKDWHLAFNSWIRREKATPGNQRPRVIPKVDDLEMPPDGLSPDEYAAWERERRRA